MYKHTHTMAHQKVQENVNYEKKQHEYTNFCKKMSIISISIFSQTFEVACVYVCISYKSIIYNKEFGKCIYRRNKHAIFTSKILNQEADRLHTL